MKTTETPKTREVVLLLSCKQELEFRAGRFGAILFSFPNYGPASKGPPWHGCSMQCVANLFAQALRWLANSVVLVPAPGKRGCGARHSSISLSCSRLQEPSAGGGRGVGVLEFRWFSSEAILLKADCYFAEASARIYPSCISMHGITLCCSLGFGKTLARKKLIRKWSWSAPCLLYLRIT